MKKGIEPKEFNFYTFTNVEIIKFFYNFNICLIVFCILKFCGILIYEKFGRILLQILFFGLCF